MSIPIRTEPSWLLPTLLLLGVGILGCLPGTASAQRAADSSAWFGIPRPPGPGETPPVMIGARGAPAVVPPGEERHRHLESAPMLADLDAIVGFSLESRRSREIGGGQLWGRIAGFPSGRQVIEWSAERMREAGVPHVEVQTFDQDAGASFWLPLTWEVRLLGDPAFGEGSLDVVLESAMPLGPGEIPGGALTAPLVYVGTGTAAEIADVDVRGRVAVQLVVPQGHTVFERDPTGPRGQALIERGAVAVLNLVRLPGNERARDMGCGGGVCFNIGGRDGYFLGRVFEEAARAGTLDRLQVRLTLEAVRESGLRAENAVGVIPGASEESILINAHADGWFDAAGDNGDGLAVMLALARHFAQPENVPQRTLIFLASAGHHSPGLHGPRNFVAMNGVLTASTVLVINLEHVAQRNIVPARVLAEDGYREWVADAGEAPIVAGVSNASPFLDSLLDEGVERYGVNFISERSTHCGGECGGFSPLGTARVGFMQAPPLYHTSGETLEVISPPGLERMARFMAFFLSEAAAVPRELINPPEE